MLQRCSNIHLCVLLKGVGMDAMVLSTKRKNGDGQKCLYVWIPEAHLQVALSGSGSVSIRECLGRAAVIKQFKIAFGLVAVLYCCYKRPTVYRDKDTIVLEIKKAAQAALS